MKISFAIGCFLFGTLANAQRVTENDCFEEEEAEFISSCNSLFFGLCDKFNIQPVGSCNVITFGNAQVDWFSQDLSANYWQFMNLKMPPPPPPPTPEEVKEEEIKQEEEKPVEKNEWAEWNWLMAEGLDDAEDSVTDLQKDSKKKDPCDTRTDCTVQCVQSTQIPTKYTRGQELQNKQGKCGYKIQITNANEKVPFLVTILRTGAVSLALPAIAASAAAIALF